MPVYARQIATALRIIKAKGEQVVWTAAPAVVDNEAEPWKQVEDGPPVLYQPRIVFFPLTRQYSELFRYLKGSEVVHGALYGLMGAQSFVPAMTGTVTRSDGKVLSVTSIDVIAPNGEAILYTIEFGT